MDNMNSIFSDLDEIDCVMAASCTDEEYYGTDESIKESAISEETEVEDIEEYDEDEDAAITAEDRAAEDFRQARDSDWENEIDDDVEDVMSEDEDDVEDEDVEFDDAWDDAADCVIDDDCGIEE